MKIAIAADHGGFDMKQAMVKRLSDAGYDVTDLGTDSNASVNYPDYAIKASEEVVGGKADRGILICGTGIGMSIAANKVRGIYCAKINTPEEGHLAAEHNNANMVALGGRILSEEETWATIKSYLEASPEFGRHEDRRALIRAVEG